MPDFLGDDGVIVPADTDFYGHRGVGNGGDHGGGDLTEFGRVAQHGGSGIHTDDPFGGTAEVNIDKVRAHTIVEHFRGFRHALGIGTEDLYAHGSLGFGKVDSFPEAGVAADDGIGLNKLGDHDIGPLFFAELTEDNIGVAGHGRQIQGEFVVFKPIEHGDSVDLRNIR